MSPTLTCLALAVVGLDLGYQPAPNGGEEFIIQINPATLQASRPGELGIDVPREAREMRPSHFTITLGNESLPHVLAASTPPATAPIVTASPVMPAAALAAPSSDLPPGSDPLRVGPPSSFAAPKTTAAHGWPLLMPSNRTRSPATATSAEPRIEGLPSVNPKGGASPKPDPPWLVMCLFVIALLASNVYVGWLFLDARQRYRGLLARTFSFGQQAAEA